MKRILVIDDDEDLLEIFKIIFQEEGYNVVLSNHAETVEHIHQISPDLVILDIRLTGSEKTGGDICAEIKEKFAKARLPVVLISAETDIRKIAELCGADGYISKPFDVAAVLLKINELLH